MLGKMSEYFDISTLFYPFLVISTHPLTMTARLSTSNLLLNANFLFLKV